MFRLAWALQGTARRGHDRGSRPPAATVNILIGFVHVLEYPWKAARSLFETGDPDAEDWVAAEAVKTVDGRPPRPPPGSAAAPPPSRYSRAERAGTASIAAALRHHPRRPGRPLRTIMNC